MPQAANTPRGDRLSHPARFLSTGTLRTTTGVAQTAGGAAGLGGLAGGIDELFIEHAGIKVTLQAVLGLSPE